MNIDKKTGYLGLKVIYIIGSEVGMEVVTCCFEQWQFPPPPKTTTCTPFVQVMTIVTKSSCHFLKSRLRCDMELIMLHG